eukprot:SAG22_NODE_3194_length_1863_cov_2.269274_1_plen_294_part_00
MARQRPRAADAVLLLLVAAAAAATARTAAAGEAREIVHLTDDTYEDLVTDGDDDAWLIMFGENCVPCKKLHEAVFPNVMEKIEKIEPVIGKTVQIGLLPVHTCPDTFERFRIQVDDIPAIKLVLPKSKTYYNFIGNKEYGGICCTLEKGCTDTKEFGECLTRMDQTLLDFVFAVRDGEQYRGGANNLPKPLVGKNKMSMDLPAVMIKQLGEAFGEHNARTLLRGIPFGSDLLIKLWDAAFCCRLDGNRHHLFHAGGALDDACVRDRARTGVELQKQKKETVAKPTAPEIKKGK